MQHLQWVLFRTHNLDTNKSSRDEQMSSILLEDFLFKMFIGLNQKSNNLGNGLLPHNTEPVQKTLLPPVGSCIMNSRRSMDAYALISES